MIINKMERGAQKMKRFRWAGAFLFILLFFQTECVQAAGTDGASQETAVHQESADEVAKKQAEALKTEGIESFGTTS